MIDPVHDKVEDGADVTIEEAAAEAGVSFERLIQLIEEGLASGEPIDGETAMRQLAERRKLVFPEQS